MQNECEVSLTNPSKVMAKVKVVCRQASWQTKSFDHSIQEMKKRNRNHKKNAEKKRIDKQNENENVLGVKILTQWSSYGYLFMKWLWLECFRRGERAWKRNKERERVRVWKTDIQKNREAGDTNTYSWREGERAEKSRFWMPRLRMY